MNFIYHFFKTWTPSKGGELWTRSLLPWLCPRLSPQRYNKNLASLHVYIHKSRCKINCWTLLPFFFFLLKIDHPSAFILSALVVFTLVSPASPLFFFFFWQLFSWRSRSTIIHLFLRSLLHETIPLYHSLHYYTSYGYNHSLHRPQCRHCLARALFLTINVHWYIYSFVGIVSCKYVYHVVPCI